MYLHTEQKIFVRLKAIKNLVTSRMTISCQVSQGRRRLARVLADEVRETFGERKGVGLSNSNLVWQRAFGLYREKNTTRPSRQMRKKKK